MTVLTRVQQRAKAPNPSTAYSTTSVMQPSDARSIRRDAEANVHFRISDPRVLLQDDSLSTDPTSSRMERWRQRCDVTLTNWLGLDHPPPGAASDRDEHARRTLSSRFGSFAKLPAFKRQSSPRGSDPGKQAAIRSEEVAKPARHPSS